VKGLSIEDSQGNGLGSYLIIFDYFSVTFIQTQYKVRLKNVQSHLKKAIFKCKCEYRDKVENMFNTNCMKTAWSNLKKLCCYSKKKSTLVVDDDVAFANELNQFYARFDTEDFTDKQNAVIQVLLEIKDESIVVDESDVQKCLSKINVKKAAGPDGLCGKVLKFCNNQLSSILSKLFQVSLDSHCIPILWKTSELIPVPKSTLPKVKNDLRPVALTAIIMKCFERLVLYYIKPVVKPFLDRYQFAYSETIGVDDAVITLNDIIRSHLDSPGSHARILFVDFSSAFNTIQPHILMEKLIKMKVNSNIVLWIHNFLTNRIQYVKFNGVKSDILVINTGAPQGCVLSAFLFTIYTTDCTSSSGSIVIIKYADDTVIIGLLKCDDDVKYRMEVDRFCNWCDDNHLNLNVSKTKEMVIDFRNCGAKANINPLRIKNQQVEIVKTYKYLGNIIDDKLSGSPNVDTLFKKLNKKMYFVRKLRSLKLSRNTLSTFYRCIIQSNFTFCLSNWYKLCTSADIKKLNKIVSCAKKLGCITTNLSDLYINCLDSKLKKIMENNNHPLHYKFSYLPSGRRLRSIPSRTNRYKNSFVLSAIRYRNLST
jgi:hypothetical protein